jgi:hypothetical protein
MVLPTTISLVVLEVLKVHLVAGVEPQEQLPLLDMVVVVVVDGTFKVDRWKWPEWRINSLAQIIT